MSAHNDDGSTSGLAARLVDAWYLPHRTPLTLLLTPLSWVFASVAALRRAMYRRGWLRSTRLPVPVIVVGNITVGGTGKTPLVIAIVDALRGRGHVPGVVSRGYGAGDSRDSPRDDAASRPVHPGDAPDEVGDEPLLLAATGAPVFIGRDRAAAARALLAAHPDVTVIVSDDGLQHYALPRDCEIVVVDAARGFGNGALLPAGPLREKPQRLRAVDAVVVNGVGRIAIPSATPSFRMTLEGTRFIRLVDGVDAGADAFRGRRVHAIAGIGNPQRFFDTLRSLGVDAATHPFPDHHRYTAADLAFPDADAIVMTAKDAIKCTPLADARMWSLPVAARVDAALFARILEKIDGPQTARNTRVPGDQGPAHL